MVRMGSPGNPLSATRYWAWAFIVGLLAAAAGAGVGLYVGTAAGEGFRFDWYVQHGVERLALGDAALVAGLATASVTLIAAVLATSVAGRVFDGHARGRVPARMPGARTRETNTFLQAGLYGGLLPAIVALLVLSLPGAQARGLAPKDFTLLLAAILSVAGFLAGALPLLATGRGLRMGDIVRGDAEENVFAKISLACARNPKGALAVVVALTLFAGYGVSLINTNVDVADVMPRGDPNTAAAKNLTEKFKSTFTQQVTFQLHIAPEELYARDNARLPNRVTEANRSNISDEVYVRAMDELAEFVKNYEGSPFTGSVGNHDFYRLIHWTAQGGNNEQVNRDGEASFRLPDTSREGEAMYALVDEAVWIAVPGTADAVISPDFGQTALLMNVDPKNGLSSKEIGQKALEIREAYVRWATENESAYKVFTGENAPMFSVDLPIANAHSSELAQHDFKTLVPIIAVFIILCLFIAFRSLGPILISFASLTVSLVWTFGAMGYMGIPLNTLNLTVIPLIMGVGIDYGIHMMNEYLNNKSKGLTDEEAFRHAGARGALALFVATANTVIALLVMVVSPSLLIAQLGILSSIAIVSSYLLAITFIPAALIAFRAKAKTVEYRPSPLMAGLARAVSRNRILAVAVLLLLCGAAYAQTANLTTEAYGDPPRNWLPDDPLRQEHETAIAGFYARTDDAVKANVIIFEGPVTTPEAHRYMDVLEAELKERNTLANLSNGEKGRIIGDTLRTLPFLMRTYLTVKDGAESFATYTAATRLPPPLLAPLQSQPQFRAYPTTQEEIEALMNEVPHTPLRAFGNLFYDYPNNEMAIMTFSVEAATYEDAEQAWFQIQAAIADADKAVGRPEGLQVSFFGNTAINYLFVAKELPWIGYMSIVSNILVLALVYIPTRKWKPTLTVGLLNFVTSIIWLGLLPSFGIGLAITLALPLIFIFAIGSDYGLHLALNIEDTKDPEETFRTTGKAILFSAITTAGAFLIFTQMSNVSVQRTMIGTSLAIGVIFLTTMLIVPVMYPIKKRKASAATAAAPGLTPEGAPVPVKVRVVMREPAEAPKVR